MNKSSDAHSVPTDSAQAQTTTVVLVRASISDLRLALGTFRHSATVKKARQSDIGMVWKALRPCMIFQVECTRESLN